MMRANLLLQFFSSVMVANSSAPRHLHPLDSSSYPVISTEHNWDGSASMLLIGSIDGSVSAFSTDASSYFPGPIWTVPTLPGPLISSSLQGIELIKDGVKVQLIPALDGSLYTYDGERIERLPVSAETILSSSFKISEDSIITGGKETSFHGIDPDTGKVRYSCGVAGCREQLLVQSEDRDDLEREKVTLVISRLTQTVRAFDVHQGNEKWNFSVGTLDVTMAKNSRTTNKCLMRNEEETGGWRTGDVEFHFDAATNVLRAASLNHSKELWTFKLNQPVTHAWMIDHGCVRHLNLVTFVPPLLDATAEIDGTYDPELIFLGHYEDQLFIQRADQKGFPFRIFPQVTTRPLLVSANTRTPAIARPYRALLDTDSQNALIDPRDYPFDGGYCVTYADCPSDNRIFTKNKVEKRSQMTVIEWLKYGLKMSGLVLLPFLVFTRGVRMYREHQLLRKPAVLGVVPSLNHQESTQSSNSLKSVLSLQNVSAPSRFCSDFEVIEKIGKGGFGVVYLAKNRLDESMYAVKKIKLPHSEAAREKVRREVRVMAKLNHVGVVRFFNAWVEASDPDPETKTESEIDDESNSTDCEDQTDGLSAISAELCQDWIGTQRNRRPSRSRKESDSLRYVAPASVNSDSENIVFEAGDSAGLGMSTSRRKRISSSSSKKSTPSLTGMSDIESDVDGVDGGDQNPNDVAKSRPQLFIQMELCRKQTLRDWLKINTESRHRIHILDIFYQIVSAVEYIHSRSLMHRDLKPSNILFSTDGRAVKIADFGLVTSMDDDEAQHSMMPDHNYLSVQNHTNQVGTTLYMSPELLSGKPYDEKVDIYSLGLIFFELLVPFKTEMERIYSIEAAKNLRFESALVSSCSQRSDENLLRELLSADPCQRPTAHQIVQSSVLQELSVVYGSDGGEFGQERKRTFSVNGIFPATL